MLYYLVNKHTSSQTVLIPFQHSLWTVKLTCTCNFIASTPVGCEVLRWAWACLSVCLSVCRIAYLKNDVSRLWNFR